MSVIKSDMYKVASKNDKFIAESMLPLTNPIY